MNEMNQIRAFLAFLFVFSVMALSQTVMAAASVVPSVPGYANGGFRSAAGSFTMMAANEGYIKPSVVNVAGKSITVPATLRMAANAGQYAKNAMRLNPYLLAGTLALAWLADNGISQNPDGTFSKTVPGDWWSVPGNIPSGEQFSSGTAAATKACVNDQGTLITYTPRAAGTYGAESVLCQGGAAWNNQQFTRSVYKYAGTPQSVPATPEDFDALPNPLPAIAPELPYAPYMPDGAPVQPPSFEFEPMNVPVGSPYTKPDSSTWQPMATVSPGGDSVTIDTYDQPINDPQGNPVPNPTPSDTPEPPPNHCDQNPNTIGCSQYGDAGAAETIPTTTLPATVTVTPVGGSGVCPADVVTTRFGITWSYQPICDFASAVRPFVLGFAWLSFAFVVAGAVRT